MAVKAWKICPIGFQENEEMQSEKNKRTKIEAHGRCQVGKLPCKRDHRNQETEGRMEGEEQEVKFEGSTMAQYNRRGESSSS